MALTAVVALLALAVSAHGSVGPSTNSSLCTESKECLQYELLCKMDEYEVRRYSPTRWLSTDAEAYFMGVGAAMAFRRLYQYITGDNEGGYKMNMTAPVLVKIPEETRMWEPAIYTLSFPLPAAYQDKPPRPNNDKLYFTEMPQMDMYVRSYGGWMLSVTSRLHSHLLTKELKRVRAAYNCAFHYGVGYDSPLKLLDRHNEVWYISEGDPVCSDPQEPTPPHPARLQSDQPTVDLLNNTVDTTSDPPSDDPLDHPADNPLDADSSQQPEIPPPSSDNATTFNSSQSPPTTVSSHQTTPNTSSQEPLSSEHTSLSSLQPTNGAPSLAPTSAQTPLEHTPNPTDPPVDNNSTQPEDAPHDEH